MIAALQKAASAPAFAGVFVKSIRLAATYFAGHPAVLSITWSWPEHCASEGPCDIPGVTLTASARPADTTILVDRPGPTVHEIERAVLACAWALGAWDVRRVEHAPLANAELWRELRYGIAVDFGCNDQTIAGSPLQIGERAPGATVRQAAESGWVTWTLIPLAMATRKMRERWGRKDRTLQNDCSRIEPMPSVRLADWHHPEPGYGHEHIYRLGRFNHGNRSKKSSDRRA